MNSGLTISTKKRLWFKNKNMITLVYLERSKSLALGDYLGLQDVLVHRHVLWYNGDVKTSTKLSCKEKCNAM